MVTIVAGLRYYNAVKNLCAIYREQKQRLFLYLLRMTGEYDLARDIMQESFTRCLERYGDSIDSAALLYRIARNLVVDYARKQARSDSLGDGQVVDPLSLEHHLMVREEYRDVLEALQQLGFEDRELLSLVAGECLSYREIASLLGARENTVKVRVHRARKRLRSILVKRGVA